MDLQRELDLLRDVLWGFEPYAGSYDEERRFKVNLDARKAAARHLGYIATDFCIDALAEFIKDEEEDPAVLPEVIDAFGWAVAKRLDEEKESTTRARY